MKKKTLALIAASIAAGFATSTPTKAEPPRKHWCDYPLSKPNTHLPESTGCHGNYTS
jgi:hypothetical protein